MEVKFREGSKGEGLEETNGKLQEEWMRPYQQKSEPKLKITCPGY